jgi:putative DNA methylase
MTSRERVTEQYASTPIVKRGVLIERWLPIAEIGIESRREHGFGTPFPAPFRLHVWWARRPLVASRAAILASLLPVWSAEWPDSLMAKFPSENSYRAWFLRFLGILGDPVAARKLIAYANTQNKTLGKNAYGYRRAFTITPQEDDLGVFLDLLEATWGERELNVLDPMAGGGSIPFEALRYGLSTYANELNPVASVVLAATIDFPARFGPELADEIRFWGKQLVQLMRERLGEFYPTPAGGETDVFVWARTVACPTTGKPVPLSPNWWLQKGNSPVAVKVLCRSEWAECRFQILTGASAVAEATPDQGTIRHGVAISPWSGDVIDSEYIRREAQAGRMGQQLYAVGVQTPQGKEFRSPTDNDLNAARAAELALARLLPSWQAQGIVPDEEVPPGNKTAEPLRFGMTHWHMFFSPRQLLAAGTYVAALREISPQIEKSLPADQSRAVRTYLAFALDKVTNYNSRMSVWHALRATVANTFDRHDFGFKWSHAEMAFVIPGKGIDWAVDQMVDLYRELATLTKPTSVQFWQRNVSSPIERLHITQGSAMELTDVPTGSISLVCVDPPYYDNVQYAELSDFFYVWLKRILGDLYPEWFRSELVDKDDEAVANPIRFADFGPKRKQLADQDYQRKMTGVFREMHRVLREDGVLTVMFTHKRVDAWDTLASALIDAGFRIEASWPVHTESETSLNQAKKNAASSTILLICRNRSANQEAVWWDDIKAKVRRVAREKAVEFGEQGISGVDLYISAFGPALSVISEQWPVLTSEVDEKTGKPKPLRPEVALDLAREEVIGLRKEGLLLGRQVQFDPPTDWYLMAWDAFKAAEFPADEGRKLAIALGLDLEADLVKQRRLVAKKQGTIILQGPRARRRRDIVDPDAPYFSSWIDAAHTAMLVYDEDGARACEQFLKRTGLLNDGTFIACLQALLNAIPRTKIKDKFLRPEADILERMRLAFFEELIAPAEEALPEAVQATLFSPEEEAEELADDEEDEDEET